MSSPAAIPPLRFVPIYKEKVWGGARLARILQREIPASAKIGESWEISGFGADQTRVATGPFAGKQTAQIQAHFGERLTGRLAGGDTFPLLYKFIDANDKLSLQVHPGDAQARAHGWGACGKTECWYIVHADPGAQAIAGFNRPVTRPEIEEAIRQRALTEILNFVDIATGDLLLIPAGTVHANLPGTLLYEVQQTSDTTLRLYDWDRNDPSRPLQLAESLSVTDTTFYRHHKIPAVAIDAGPRVQKKLRVACRYFALAEYCFGPGGEAELPPVQSFQVISVITGAIVARCPGIAEILMKGQTILLPASLRPVRIDAKDHARMLLSWVPDLKKEIIRPLRAQGISDEAIVALGGNPARNDIRLALQDIAE